MKYKLTDETKVVGVTTLHRIKALKTFGNVTKGDLGGWVETESNLSQLGNAWVYGNARVYCNAIVYGNARVYGNTEVFGDAWVFDDAWVCGNAIVYGNARVYGNAEVSGATWVAGDTIPKNSSSVAKQLKEKGIKLGIK